MAHDRTTISWTDATWSPTTGCDRVSPGCDHCYALTMAGRLKAMGQPAYQQDGDPRTSGPGFGLTVHPDRLDQPLRWRQPRRVFVNSMSDLFHPKVPDEFLAEVFAVMALTPRHTYQVLTKRAPRMRHLLTDAGWVAKAAAATMRRSLDIAVGVPFMGPRWPLPNVWLGVSVEDQQRADQRIPDLLQTPAAVRFLSCEPLLGPVDLDTAAVGWSLRFDDDHRAGYGPLDWVIIGGESGHDARPMHPDWARSLVAQCRAASVAVWVKQRGTWEWVGPVYDQADDDEEADDARMEAVVLEVDEGRHVIELMRSGEIVAGYQPPDERTWLMVRGRGKGEHLDDLPEDLRIREFPAGVRP